MIVLRYYVFTFEELSELIYGNISKCSLVDGKMDNGKHGVFIHRREDNEFDEVKCKIVEVLE